MPLVYACQKQQGDADRCGFFLWDDDAKPREESAVLGNARSEPERKNNTPARPPPQRAAPAHRVASPPPPYTIEATAAEASRKRSRTVVDDEDDYGLDAGDSAFDDELDRARLEAETPRKIQRVESLTTPRRKLPWGPSDGPAIGFPTPQTERHERNDPFATRLAYPGGSLLTPSRLQPFEEEETHAITPSSSFGTPTPSRFRDAGAPPTENSLTMGVFKLLSDENIHLPTRAEAVLKNLLAKHAEGKKRGQDLLRKQIQAKDAKITEITHRNNTLQAELEVEKSMVQLLQSGNDIDSDT